ncbi:odorant receptor 33a-like [Hermetia illucens]|uniref:odorant receptor 33a-like n=1 Tax=Hermetia illucens TaxID=343691 RepID=UPI0018CC14B8|nr:odorant receptor 33a-like [Hermetia illucens]
MSLTNPKVFSVSKNSSKNEIESIRAFGVIFFTLRFQGMALTEDYQLRHKIHVIANYILINIIYYSSFIIQLFYVSNLRQLLENVPMNLCVTACCIKFFVILRLRPSLIEINKQLKRLDTRPMTDKQKDQLRGVIKFCRMISLSVTLFYLGVNLTYALASALSHGTKLGFETWFPYDYKKNPFRFWISLLIQTAFQQQLSLEQVPNDFLGALYLSVLGAHLEIIMERFADIHYDPEKTEEESFQDFIKCIDDHQIIINIFETIQNTLSITIFIQCITSILAFSTAGLIYLRFSPSFTETVAAFVFMVAEVTEIFPSCYYSDKFMEKTDRIVFMLYSSNWMDLSPRFRKHLIIFMQMTQKKKVILAGKQIPITLATFMSVMKAMYTVLMIMKPSE